MLPLNVYFAAIPQGFAISDLDNRCPVADLAISFSLKTFFKYLISSH